MNYIKSYLDSHFTYFCHILTLPQSIPTASSGAPSASLKLGLGSRRGLRLHGCPDPERPVKVRVGGDSPREASWNQGTWPSTSGGGTGNLRHSCALPSLQYLDGLANCQGSGRNRVEDQRQGNLGKRQVEGSWTWVPKPVDASLGLILVPESIYPPGAGSEQLDRMAHPQPVAQPLSSDASVFVQRVCEQRGQSEKDVGYTKVQKQGLPIPKAGSFGIADCPTCHKTSAESLK